MIWGCRSLLIMCISRNIFFKLSGESLVLSTILIATCVFVTTCVPSLTTAKFPLPIVLSREYWPTRTKESTLWLLVWPLGLRWGWKVFRPDIFLSCLSVCLITEWIETQQLMLYSKYLQLLSVVCVRCCTSFGTTTSLLPPSCLVFLVLFFFLYVAVCLCLDWRLEKETVQT